MRTQKWGFGDRLWAGGRRRDRARKRIGNRAGEEGSRNRGDGGILSWGKNYRYEFSGISMADR